MILSGVRRVVLSNGLTVLIRPDSESEAVAIVTYVKAGYFDEPDDVVGISHVLEHMYFKGTPTRGVGEIARETKASGGYLNAHTIYDHTSYYTVLPAASFAKGLAIQADAYRNSSIDALELKRELEVIIQEANRKEDNPSAVVTESLYALLHDRHRIRRWRIGREDGLRALGREHMLNFYRSNYRPSNTILAIAGGVDGEAALSEVELLYGDIPPGDVARDRGPLEPATREFRYMERSGDIARTQLAIGWRTAPLTDPVTPVLDLAAMLLSSGRASRLYRSVRERRLASSIAAYNYTPTEVGVFVVHAEAEPHQVAQAASAIETQIQSLREDPVAQPEIDRARRLFESRWIRQLETVEGQAHYLAEWEAQGDWTLGDAYYDRIFRADAADVQQAARQFLAPDLAAVMIYRPQSAPAVARDSREFRSLLQADEGGRSYDAPRIPPPVMAGKARRRGEQNGVQVHGTAGGVPILIRRRSGVPMVHLAVVVKAGAARDPEERAGLALLLARTALKGTSSRSAEDLAAESEVLGGSISATVSTETIGWSISVPSARFEEAAELLADVVRRPVFESGSLETERAVALSDLASFRDDMYSYPAQLAISAAYGDHPYARTSLGTERSLSAISSADLRARHESSVLAGPSVIGIVGDVDPQRAADVVSGLFDGLRYAKEKKIVGPAWPGAGRVTVEERDKSQTALAMAFPGPRRSDDSRFAARLISVIASGLGGRFFDELRDRQSLAYTVGVHVSERSEAGAFIAYIATAPEKEEDARAGLLREFARLREDLVTSEELARAQEYAVGTHVIRRETNGAVLSDILDGWLFGSLAEPSEFEQKIRAVNREQLRDLSAASFDPSTRAEGIVRGR